MGENKVAVCDICSVPGHGSVISAEDMRQAVFEKGFDPYALDLIKNSTHLMFGAAAAYDTWKNAIVAQDTSDWNI
jgi:hypothetical protein